jgi:large subunit ribosomal protein L10
VDEESLPNHQRGKDFLLKGGNCTLAITKEHKEELVAQYGEWLKSSQATILAEYNGLSMKDVDALRAKIREAGGEFHIVKNTLGKLAFEKAGLSLPASFFTGSTAVGFAFKDAPALAKVMTEFARTNEALKVKGGYLESRPMDAAGVKSLADLPPLPVVRAQLLGTILAPASKLVRTLAEPGRQIAAVIKAYSEASQPVAA